MTTTDPQAEEACQQHTTPSFPPPSVPCHDNDASSLLARPEWIPLDEVAETWADFSVSGITHAHALQAVGNAFLALSFEMSAHSHYTQAYHGIWRCTPATVAHGIAEAISDLREACGQWVCAYQWLERSANEARHDEEHLADMRALFESIAAQQQRLWVLLSRLQKEQRGVQAEDARVVHLGHLSSVAAEEQEQKER
jgi:hypothetical protein